MAESGHHEKEYASTDPVGAVNDTHTSEPVAAEPLQMVVSDTDSTSSEPKNKDQPPASRTLTTTTTTSSQAPESESGAKKPWYKSLNPLKRRTKPPIPKERIVSREYGASFLSLLTFQWMAPIMRTGYQRPLELNDIWLVNPDRGAGVLSDKLRSSFNKRVARGERYPLIFAMHETFKFEFWVGGICQLVSSITQVMAPFTLRYLIAFATRAYFAQQTRSPAPHIGQGIGLVIGISCMQMLQSMCTHHFIYRGQTVGGQSRAVLITLIFEKAMKISGRAKAGGKAIEGENLTAVKQNPDSGNQTKDNFLLRTVKNKTRPKGGPRTTPDKAAGVLGDGAGWGNGRIVNLMSTDTYRVDQASGMFHLVWTSPIAILITLVVVSIIFRDSSFPFCRSPCNSNHGLGASQRFFDQQYLQCLFNANCQVFHSCSSILPIQLWPDSPCWLLVSHCLRKPSDHYSREGVKSTKLLTRECLSLKKFFKR